MIESEMRAVLKRIANPAWADDLWRQHKPLGPELDVLATDVPATVRSAMLTALGGLKPRQKLAVLCTMRNEALILPEFIAHYLGIGANHIFIYTNDNSDGTDAVLRWFSGCAPVTVIHSVSAPGVNVQAKHYGHALLLLPELRLYEWVLVVDADEFLVPAARHDHHLRTMLAAAPADTDMILLPWRWRLWDLSFERKPGLLAERFPHARAHAVCKPLVRLGCVTSLKPVHVPDHVDGAVIRDSAFEVIPEGLVRTGGHVKSYDGGWIEHFWGRSYEEFLIKQQRGANGELGEDGKRKRELFFTWSAPLTAANYVPVPEAVVARQRAQLARFAARPGFAALMARVEAGWRDCAARQRKDPALRREYEELLKLPPLQF